MWGLTARLSDRKPIRATFAACWASAPTGLKSPPRRRVMLKASLGPLISTPGVRTYFRGALGLDPPPSGLVLEPNVTYQRRRALRGVGCMRLLGSLWRPR